MSYPQKIDSLLLLLSFLIKNVSNSREEPKLWITFQKQWRFSPFLRGPVREMEKMKKIERRKIEEILLLKTRSKITIIFSHI